MGHYISNACGFRLWERRDFQGDLSNKRVGLVAGFYRMLQRDQGKEHWETDMVPLAEDIVVAQRPERAKGAGRQR